MKTWLRIAGAVFVGFVCGWFASNRMWAPRSERCHAALQYLTKGATLEQIAHASKLLSGE